MDLVLISTKPNPQHNPTSVSSCDNIHRCEGHSASITPLNFHHQAIRRIPIKSYDSADNFKISTMNAHE
ncbi:hypothetical protein QR680_000019 [Steinernema hermaphroditum]|uniref:Uncharacterized protein n=1 Tax=Steinernema hermaphroditum TaxID=289476 RepID=A0AA39GUY4_9BILA|nr:hypothetical protein QR680_000019 [Steinernema hermaphroditum]